MDFDLRLASECAKSFSVSSGIGCMVSSAAGEILYQHGQCCAACTLCALAGLDSNRCRSTHLYGMHEAERFGGKYIYFCAMGLTCFTSPITGPDRSTAPLTVGPFLMVDEQDYADYELSFVLHLPPDRVGPVMDAVHELPHVEASRVTAMAEILFMAVAFMNNVSQSSRLLELQEVNAQQGQISSYIHELKQSGPSTPYPFRTERALLQAMGRGNADVAQQLLNELLGHVLFSSGGDAFRIRCRMGELLALMSRIAAENGVNPESVFAITNEYYQGFHGQDDIETLCARLSKAMRQFMEIMFSDRGVRHLDAIHRAVQHIQAHYGEKLTLESIAHTVSISPSYLSRTFKKEAGISLMQFLNRVRIEKSKALLANSSTPLAQIAQQCGFEDQSYYTKVFKSVCGTTPLQFRKSSALAHKGRQEGAGASSPEE